MASILYFEDDFRLAMESEDILTAAGHEVSLAQEFEAALALCLQREFDLVIADLFILKDGKVVPEGGYNLIMRLRSTKPQVRRTWWRDVPILAVSGGLTFAYGLDPKFDPAKPIKHGATSTLAKPFSPEQLLEKVEVLLAGTAPSGAT